MEIYDTLTIIFILDLIVNFIIFIFFVLKNAINLKLQSKFFYLIPFLNGIFTISYFIIIAPKFDFFKNDVVVFLINLMIDTYLFYSIYQNGHTQNDKIKKLN